jgi:hypothetical protein
MTMLPEGHRPPDDLVEQECEHCGIRDTAPRHHVVEMYRHPTDAERMVDFTRIHHIDCGATAGCDVCGTHAEFTGGVKDDALRAALLSPTPEHAAALVERHGAVT